MSADLDSADDSIANQLILRISQRGYISYIITHRVFCDIFNLRVRASARVCKYVVVESGVHREMPKNCKSCNKVLWL